MSHRTRLHRSTTNTPRSARHGITLWMSLAALATAFVVARPRAASAQVVPGAAPANVLVQLESNNPLIVMQARGGQAESHSSAWMPDRVVHTTTRAVSWMDVCTAPCNRRLSRNAVYRITGEGVNPSGPFVLPLGDAVLHVSAGSATLSGVGTAVGVAVGGAAIFGAILLPLGLAVDDEDLWIPGAALLGTAVVLAVPMAIMLAASATRVRTHTGQPLARTRVQRSPVAWVSPFELRF